MPPHDRFAPQARPLPLPKCFFSPAVHPAPAGPVHTLLAARQDPVCAHILPADRTSFHLASPPPFTLSSPLACPHTKQTHTVFLGAHTCTCIRCTLPHTHTQPHTPTHTHAQSHTHTHSRPRSLHDALSGHTSSSVAEAVRYSEESRTKCIGLTIETRPDHCLTPHLTDMLSYGCTRLEMGVQVGACTRVWQGDAWM